MTVIVLTAVPAGLRGSLTRWLMEVSPGVFVGRVSARIRDLLWFQVAELLRDGRAIMINSARNEQHMEVRTLRHDWEPVDLEGITLMKRPSESSVTTTRRLRHGWSAASKRRQHKPFKDGE